MSAETEVPRHRSRKDKQRWCKGKPGLSHAWGPWKVWHCLGFGFTQRTCLDCHKKSPMRRVP